jgi:hypothetical protein
VKLKLEKAYFNSRDSTLTTKFDSDIIVNKREELLVFITEADLSSPIEIKLIKVSR